MLAASPTMKKRFRVKTGTRLYEIPNHPEIRLFEPKMAYFLEISMAITRILHKYVPAEAIHVYSVDESFIDLSGTEKLWGDPVQTVRGIQAEILETLNLPSTAGMGPNMLMAKLALDLEAKKQASQSGPMKMCKKSYGQFPTLMKCGGLVVRRKNL